MKLTFLWCNNQRESVEMEFADSVKSLSFRAKCSFENVDDIVHISH